MTRGWQLIDKQSPNIIKPSRYTFLPLEQGKAVAVDKNCFVGGASEEKRTVSIQGEMNYEHDFFFHCSVRAAKTCFALSAMIYRRLNLSSQMVIYVLSKVPLENKST